MKKSNWYVKLVAMFLTFIVVATLCGCSNNKKEIAEVTSNFEIACNKLDIDAMLDCINPAISDKIKLATGIASMFTDKKPKEMTDELVSLLTGDSSLNADDFFSSINLSTEKLKIKSKTAVADTVVKYSIAGEKFEKKAVFEYIKVEDKWYISKFSFK